MTFGKEIFQIDKGHIALIVICFQNVTPSLKGHVGTAVNQDIFKPFGGGCAKVSLCVCRPDKVNMVSYLMFSYKC